MAGHGVSWVLVSCVRHSDSVVASRAAGLIVRSCGDGNCLFTAEDAEDAKDCFDKVRGAGSANPDDPQRHAFHGLALAYAGRRADATADGERGVALLPVVRDAVNGPYQVHVLARIYLLAGDREKAMDVLEQLLRQPYYLSRAWLSIDPTFASLKGNPRFEQLQSP